MNISLQLGFFFALLSLVAAPTLQAQTSQVHDNGIVQYEVFDDGNLGTHSPAPFAGAGFAFMGEPGAALFASTVLVGRSATTVAGTAYVSGDFVALTPVAAGTAPAPFDEAYETSFNDSGLLPTPNGIVVHHASYTSTTAGLTDFVVLDYMIENASGGTLSDVYVGNFSDWDVDTAVNNQACFDPGTETLYVFAEGGATTAHYGVAPGSGSASGWDADGSAGNPTDANLWTAMTTTGTCSTTQGDRRVTIGQGPFTIPNGESQHVQYCVAAGEDLADLLDNVAACQAALVVAIEPGPDGTPGTHNLSAVYPNPFNPQARFTLEVAEQQNVRIAVYDVLGREVASLFNGTLSAGPAHEFTIDGADLPSGSYMVRAFGEHFFETRSVTLTK